MRRCCARRWKAPLAPPTPMADGTGRRPTTPVRRPPSCSFASSVRPCARVPIRLPRCCRCWQRSPAFFPPTPAVRKRARRFSSLARPSRLVSRRAPRPRSRRPMLCWSLRPARACSPSWPSCRVPRSFSTSSPKPALDFFHFSFPASPSHASTPPISTIISTPASRQASC